MLKRMRMGNDRQVPSAVGSAIDRYCNDHPVSYPSLNQAELGAALVALQCLVSEIDYLLADRSEVTMRRSARAFAHLQKCIIADDEIQKRWATAFTQGETACEKLGAAHLLLHGIYAFKVDTKGARTDLVLSQAVIDDDVLQVAEGLVLTEWKKVTAAGRVSNLAASARKQAARYSSEPLAGLELTTYRYIVLVSDRRIDEPENIVENGVMYRHINIAVEPKTPSVEASRWARQPQNEIH